MRYINKATRQIVEQRPDRIGGTMNPTEDQYRQAGWRRIIEADPVADGYRRVSETQVDTEDGATFRAAVVDRLITDIEAEEKQAADAAAAQAVLDAEAAAKARQQAMVDALTPLVPLAQLYRATLRGIFEKQFPGAESNRALTREIVASFFLQQIAAKTMTDELRDAQQVLEFGFAQLSPIVGDDPPQTWDLPWEVVP